MPSKQQAAKEAAKVILPPEPVDPAVWQGKQCSDMDALHWVIENHDEDPEPTEAPSKFAWKYLKLAKLDLVKFAVEVHRGIIKSANDEQSMSASDLRDDEEILELEVLERALAEAEDYADADADPPPAEDAPEERPVESEDPPSGPGE